MFLCCLNQVKRYGYENTLFGNRTCWVLLVTLIFVSVNKFSFKIVLTDYEYIEVRFFLFICKEAFKKQGDWLDLLVS